MLIITILIGIMVFIGIYFGKKLYRLSENNRLRNEENSVFESETEKTEE